MQEMHTKQKGFNIIELMVVLAAAAILLSVGVPSFRGVIMDNRMSNQSNGFVTAINSARSYAVRYQRNATICATADHSAAVPTCDATTDWSNGWFIWVDKNRDTITDANEIISVHEPLPDTSTFSSTAASAFTYGCARLLGKWRRYPVALRQQDRRDGTHYSHQ